MSQAQPSRYAVWRASWDLALRLARRDVRRHRGRSLVVTLMVGIPTALLTFVLTFYWTSATTSLERLPYQMGTAAAVVGTPAGTAIAQSGSSSAWSNADLGIEGDPGNEGSPAKAPPPAPAVPGYDAEADASANAAAIGRFFGGTAYPMSTPDVRVIVGDRRISMSSLAVDARAEFGPKAELLTGRWATNDSEVVVTSQGVKRGLPTSGSLTVAIGSTTKTVTVVGTADAWNEYQMVDLVSLTPLADPTNFSTQWLIVGPAVTWPLVEKASAHGLPVQSAELTRHPVPDAQLPTSLREMENYEETDGRMFAIGGGTILTLVTGLLVAPAFAVSAARQRRSLALAASNGATSAQLRRTVLGQALVLGALAAAIGATVGIAAAWILTTVSARTSTFRTVQPFEIPTWPVLGITLCAMIAAIAAALVPARRLGRLDIVGVMRGQNVSPKASRIAPILGLVLMAAGGFTLIWAVSARAAEWFVLVGTVALVLGALLVIPMMLVLAGRSAMHLPVGLRMATRDAARQRSRSVPAVAAIVGAVAALTTIGIALASDTAEQAAHYTPMAPYGEGMLWPDDPTPEGFAALEELVSAKVPELVLVNFRTIGPEAFYPGGQAALDKAMEAGDDVAIPPQLALVPAGCTAVKALSDPIPETPQAQARATSGCRIMGTNSPMMGQIGVLPAAEIIRRLHLTGADAERIRAGGVVVMGPASTVTDGKASFALGTGGDMETGSMTPNTKVTQEFTLPALRVAADKDSHAAMNGSPLVFTAEAVRELKWTPSNGMLNAYSPDGPITKETQQKVYEALGRDWGFEIERGFQREDAKVMAILVGVFVLLILVITLTTTALGLAEQQREDATFAAVGATRRTRRVMAAAMSSLTAGIGVVIGMAVGFFPGYAFTYPLTAQWWDGVTGLEHRGEPWLEIPWASFGVILIGVPLLAALISAVAVRRAPQVTRRAT